MWDLSPLRQKQAKGHIGYEGSAGGNGSAASEAGAAELKSAGNPELWSVANFGKSAGAIFERLSTTPVSAAELARRSGKGKRTVERALNRLASEGLAERAPAGWIRGPAILSEVAANHETARAATSRRGRHERERAAYEGIKARGSHGNSH